MDEWRKRLAFDPLPRLLNSGDEALSYFARRELLGEDPGPIEPVWESPGARKILKGQLPEGSWPKPGEWKHPAVDCPLIETWKRFRFLVERYGCTKQHPGARTAAEFIFSRQTEEGDIRGFLANQYATYYTGALMGLLIRAGYGDDPRIENGFRWLLSMRQDDGGWTIPILMHGFDGKTMYRLASEHADPVQPDRSKPFSHNATGMILRAFAAHPGYRRSAEARKAAELLASRFFREDSCTSYRSADYWCRFQHPFWWNNLVSALDSVTMIGMKAEDEAIARAVEWLVSNQEESGVWRLDYGKKKSKSGEDEDGLKSAGTLRTESWVCLAVCRILKRLYV